MTKKKKPKKKTAKKPKKVPMTRTDYRRALDELGLTVAGKGTAAALAIGLRQVQRIYHGDSPVPPPVAKLLGLYLKHGIDEDDVAY